MSRTDVLAVLRQEIKKHDKPLNHINYQQFFKEKLEHPTGLKTAVLRKISNRIFRSFKGWSKDEILDFCDQLLTSRERYFRFFAFDWASKSSDRCEKADFRRFESWLKTHVDNWGACDHLCCGPIGNVILQHPELVAKARIWARSRNRWLRRGAAVSLIVPVRKGMLLDEVFRTADILLTDDDDMVQKGYGWMLKDASLEFPDEVFRYVMKHKAAMPRTALRYAIERYPADRRKKAMQK